MGGGAWKSQQKEQEGLQGGGVRACEGWRNRHGVRDVGLDAKGHGARETLQLSRFGPGVEGMTRLALCKGLSGSPPELGCECWWGGADRR